MRFNSVRTGDYSQSAKAVTSAADKIFDASRASAPDFTKISKEAIKGRSLERRTATEAEGRVALAGIDALRQTKKTRIQVDTAKEVEKIKRPARRMAGIVAGLGGIAGAALMNKDNEEAKKERQELKQHRQQLQQRQLEIYEQGITDRNEYRNALINRNQETTQSIEQSDSPTVDPGSTPKPSNAGSTKSVPTAPKPTLQAKASPPPSVPTGAISPAVDGQSIGMRYMHTLTKNGFSPVQAAAMVGHLDYESAGFTAMEEYEPNILGTRGYGHLQWTNIPGNFKPGGQRRTDFETYASRNKLKPSSFEANSGFLMHEFNNGQGVWTGGGSAQEFYQINNLEEASAYLRRNYIRPSSGSEQRRIDRGHGYLNQWNQQGN